MATGRGFLDPVGAPPRSGENSPPPLGNGAGTGRKTLPAVGAGAGAGENPSPAGKIPRPAFNTKLHIYPSFANLNFIILKGILVIL